MESRKGERMAARGARLAPLALAAACLLTSGCTTDISQLALVKDKRLTFTAPEHRELVELPIEVRWEMSDFRPVRPGSGPRRDDAGYFALFVDRAPVRPGETLAAVAKDDPGCRPDFGCPDADYLADRGIYTTTETSFLLEVVRPLRRNEDVQLHEVTVILLDSEGHRIGESAWTQQFKLGRKVFS